MELNDFYRKLTTDGSVYLKMGEIVVKNADAVLYKMHEMLPETWPTRQKLVFFMLGFQKEHRLDPVQAMQLWMELDSAARDEMLAWTKLEERAG